MSLCCSTLISHSRQKKDRHLSQMSFGNFCCSGRLQEPPKQQDGSQEQVFLGLKQTSLGEPILLPPQDQQAPALGKRLPLAQLNILEVSSEQAEKEYQMRGAREYVREPSPEKKESQSAAFSSHSTGVSMRSRRNHDSQLRGRVASITCIWS